MYKTFKSTAKNVTGNNIHLTVIECFFSTRSNIYTSLAFIFRPKKLYVPIVFFIIPEKLNTSLALIFRPEKLCVSRIL